MRSGPTNRNVPQCMWERDVREYEEYLRLREMLMQMGLSDPQADEYLDAYEELSRMLDSLGPHEEDFRVDDHSRHFERAALALGKMRELLGYGENAE